MLRDPFGAAFTGGEIGFHVVTEQRYAGGGLIA
jgi:hypothetical protein